MEEVAIKPRQTASATLTSLLNSWLIWRPAVKGVVSLTPNRSTGEHC
jgi:hypothetical protein